MPATLFLLTAALALTGPRSQADAGKVILEMCPVSLIDEAKVAAEEAGVIVALEPHEGDYVQEGMLLGRIKDDQARAEKLLAQKEEELARIKAGSDLEIRLGKKSEALTKAEWEQVRDAIQKVAGAKSKAEERVKLFNWEKAILQTEQARLDKQMNGVTAEAKAAQVQVAEQNIDRRQIKAPITGKVVKRFLHVGEWANPGDPVLHIVRLDRLRVEAHVNPKEYGPADLNNRLVELRVELAGGRPATFPGKITFVNFELEPGGEKLLVWAEVVNREENGEWLLQPELKGELAIDLDHAAAPHASKTNDRSTQTPALR